MKTGEGSEIKDQPERKKRKISTPEGIATQFIDRKGVVRKVEYPEGFTLDYSGDKRDKREVGYHDTHIEEKPPKVRPEDRPYADPIPDTFDPKLQSRLDSFEEALANPVRDGVFLPPT